MNLASGNSSNKSLIRAVCGGDFRISGRPQRNCTFFRNPTKACFHSTSSFGSTSLKVRYRLNRLIWLGNTQPMQGDRKHHAHNANSSSCGEARLSSTLSIGLRLGTKNDTNRESAASDERKMRGN